VNVALHCTHAVIAAPAKFSRMRLFFILKKVRACLDRAGLGPMLRPDSYASWQNKYSSILFLKKRKKRVPQVQFLSKPQRARSIVLSCVWRRKMATTRGGGTQHNLTGRTTWSQGYKVSHRTWPHDGTISAGVGLNLRQSRCSSEISMSSAFREKED